MKPSNWALFSRSLMFFIGESNTINDGRVAPICFASR
jgi:hypothetical protein